MPSTCSIFRGLYRRLYSWDVFPLPLEGDEDSGFHCHKHLRFSRSLRNVLRDIELNFPKKEIVVGPLLLPVDLRVKKESPNLNSNFPYLKHRGSWFDAVRFIHSCCTLFCRGSPTRIPQSKVLRLRIWDRPGHLLEEMFLVLEPGKF